MSLPADIDQVSLERRAAAAIDALLRDEQNHAREFRRPRLFTAREGLLVLQFEVLVVAVAACNLANGGNLSPSD